MRQLISRPIMFCVLGIGVLALLMSQFRRAQNSSEANVSQLDPFRSLESLSEKDLMKWPADSVVEADDISQPSANVAAAAEPMTLPISAPAYSQTSAMPLQDLQVPQDIEEPTAELAMEPPVENDGFEVEFNTLDLPVPNIDAPNFDTSESFDEEVTVLDMESPIEMDTELSEQRYEITEIDQVADTTMSDEGANAVTAMTQTPQVKTPATLAVTPHASLRRGGWRSNPFITDATNVAGTTTPGMLEGESSSNMRSLRGSQDSFNQESVISSDIESAEQDAKVTSFEMANLEKSAGSASKDTSSLNSIMSAEQDVNAELPVVVGLPESVAHKAVHNIEYGKSLSRRGSAFAARQEFYSALGILAQAHDTKSGRTGYTQALRDAIVALKEAEDFLVSDTETQIGLNVGAVIEGHSTKIITPQEASSMTAIGAMQRYFALASHQLRLASGQNVVAAEALYCLGKLHTVQAKYGTNTTKLDIAKAIVFHQAAMSADQTNFRSANELGVLMANSGRLQESQILLKQSLQIKQLPQAWKNLAVVHQRSGQNQLAQLAHQEFLIASQQRGPVVAGESIRWVAPTTFNQGTPIQHATGTTPAPTQPPAARPQVATPTIGQRLKSIF